MQEHGNSKHQPGVCGKREKTEEHMDMESRHHEPRRHQDTGFQEEMPAPAAAPEL